MAVASDSFGLVGAFRPPPLPSLRPVFALQSYCRIAVPYNGQRVSGLVKGQWPALRSRMPRIGNGEMWLPTVALGVFGCVVAISAVAEEDLPEPYTGQQTRVIKALSDEDVASLRKGEGMGMAKAAELNGFPGPAHVIALSRELNLTNAQLHQASLVFERMNGAAKSIGSEIVSREEALDQLFASKAVTVEQLKAETATIGELQGRLRAVHLTAHVEMRALLTPEQIVRYQELRGYSNRLLPMTHHDAQ